MPPKTPGEVPELPEVETIRRDLDRELTGRRIEGVEASGTRSIRRHRDAAEFAAALVGATVESVARRGKYLAVALDRGGTLIVHLGMSGQLLLAGAGDTVVAHTHVVLSFDGHRELRFVDPRTFGEVFVTGAEPAYLPHHAHPSYLAHLGADPLQDLKGWADLAERLHARRARLKPLLMDQRFLAGIGNLYADEILFAARLRYDRSSDSLTAAEVRRLYRAMTVTLNAAIGHRGSSLADEQYRDVFGKTGGFQSLHRVYAREGQPCLRCRQAIVRIKTAGRSTFLCPRCQA